MRRQPFEAVVAEHGPTVLRVCRAVLGAGAFHDAEEAWSETFLAALRAYPDLPEGSNVQAWLVTIAHRKAVDQHRAAARRPAPVAETPSSAGSHGIPGGEGGGIAGGPDTALWEAMARLPLKQRACVAYHHLAGLPYAEVAEIVGGSTDAARRAAADGIAALRRTYLNGEAP